MCVASSIAGFLPIIIGGVGVLFLQILIPVCIVCCIGIGLYHCCRNQQPATRVVTTAAPPPTTAVVSTTSTTMRRLTGI